MIYICRNLKKIEYVQVGQVIMIFYKGRILPFSFLGLDYSLQTDSQPFQICNRPLSIKQSFVAFKKL